MDISAGWQIAGGVLTVAGGGALNIWYVGRRMGKHEGSQAKAVKDLETWRRDEERRRIGDGQEAQRLKDREDNHRLRIYQAIEELRRKLGNGDREWYDLTGG